jgi:hypothetical protein
MTSQMTEPHARAALPNGRGKGPGGQPPGLLTPAGRLPGTGLRHADRPNPAHVPPPLEPDP